MSVKFTKQQTAIINAFEQWMDDDETPAMVVQGAAGTGKSFLTHHFARRISARGGSVAAIAPTHKACKVLASMLKSRDAKIMTIASLLGKLRQHSYIGTRRFSRGKGSGKMRDFDYFILDEVSMVPDRDLEVILDMVCEADKKILIVGDKNQIPAPSQHLVEENGMLVKSNSLAFDIENIFNLTEIVRQNTKRGEGGMILALSGWVSRNMDRPFDMKSALVELKLSSLAIDPARLYEEYADMLKKDVDTRIIAYTNKAVRRHNKEVRARLKFRLPICLGELLTGYSNVGCPKRTIENGADYIVKRLELKTTHKILNFRNLVGYRARLMSSDAWKSGGKSYISDSSEACTEGFFIKPNHPMNASFMKELIRRAEKVNKRRSAVIDFVNYQSLKNKVLFLDNIYRYEDVVMTEEEFIETHPLLFTQIRSVCDDKGKVMSPKVYEEIKEQYGEIFENRLADNNPIGDTEVLADKYMIVERDIYYGYSVTAHKSQGSTYTNVYVDCNDFSKMRPRWNWARGMTENKVREKNQLQYVACTRASDRLRLITSSEETALSLDEQRVAK
jgi:hypothetical protein